MADEQSPENQREPVAGSGEKVLEYRSAPREERGSGFFTIYKKGQGYWTRMGTAVGAIIISALLANFVYGRLVVLKTIKNWTVGYAVLFGIAALVFAALMTLAWRLMNKPGNADFLIATDSEMKKVNWTTRKELIGSTKVVIVFVILIALILFVLDVVFGYLFQLMKVLEFGPFQS